MRFLSLGEVLELHRRIVAEMGGASGVRGWNGLQSALAQPSTKFEGEDLYPSVAEKAAALGFSLIRNHPFVDGNKRAGHTAMELFLLLNGFEIDSTVDEQERIILGVAAGEVEREELVTWMKRSLVARDLERGA